MKKIFFVLFIYFMPIINCHISIVAKLIIDPKYKLKGTFTINSAIIKNSYLSIEKEKILFSKKKQKFDIIELNNNSYYIISRYTKSFLGIDKNKGNGLRLYKEHNNKIAQYINWNLISQESNLTKMNIVYTIKNNFNNKYICDYNNSLYLESFPTNKNFSFENYQFRILKLYSEEENIKEANHKIVEKEPIDLFMKYIDLSDKNLKREGIKQIFKDYDAEELRYSLRSILKYIPWIRKIFIVMPNEKVKFLKPIEEIKDKFVYVNDKDFLGYDSANIFAFSFNLHKMEKFGISKNFIYMEDDYFIGRPLKKTDFFYYDEKERKVLPYVITNFFSELNVKKRLEYFDMLYHKKDNIKVHGNKGWRFSVLSTDKFLIEKYDNKTNIINAEFTHNAVPENIDDLKEIFKEIQDYKYINETLFSPTRHIMTLNQPHFVNMYQLNIKKRKVNIIPSLYINMENSRMFMLKYPLFVLNTCGDNIPTKKNYLHLSNIMKKRFPNSTKYEIEEIKKQKNYTFDNTIEYITNKINLIEINQTIEQEAKTIIIINDTNKNLSISLDKKHNIDDSLKINNYDKTDLSQSHTILNYENKTIQNVITSMNETDQIKIEEINNDKNINKLYYVKYYPIHGYILLGILLILIIFIKFKNMYEYEY